MPPARSGISDYSAALAAELRFGCNLTVFDQMPAAFDVDAFDAGAFDAGAFDAILYQIGNNADHAFVYEMALRYPGIVVLHEANLHHLIADITIRRGDWAGYLEECEYDGGASALAYAQRARQLTVGPDYDGVPMLRRVLSRARGLIVHSQFVLERARQSGYEGPAAVIPHGAWVEGPSDFQAHQSSRMAVRARLGLDSSTPLIGAFGFLKPYKRIAQTLRSLRRLLRVEPGVKMILGGEPHPEFPVAHLLRTLEIQPSVRLLGYTPESEFAGYIDACDVIVNLRYPTVGESSGSLLRAFSAGRAALVSNVGAFAELPDDVCLKVDVGASEEDLIFEYLRLLVTRPEVAKAIGFRARAWVEQNCTWRLTAERYLAFAQSMMNSPEEAAIETPASVPLARVEEPVESAPAPAIDLNGSMEYIRGWVSEPEAQAYCDQHAARLTRTLAVTPPGDCSQSILEMGAYLQITPALRSRLGYGRVRGCYYGRLGRTDRRWIKSADNEEFECLIDQFDAEKDPYPYERESFDTVLCCELIEHLASDPMHLMSEVNRILKPGGHLVLTTPNIVSDRAVSAILNSYHPGFFTSYLQPKANGDSDARHNREYAPGEIQHLFSASGFAMVRLETGPFGDEPHPEFHWVRLAMEQMKFQTYWRGDGIYAVGRKSGPVRERFPIWLYA